MHDEFLKLVPAYLYERSGRVFYSGRSAFDGKRPLYLLGLNPGGDPVRQAEETISRSIVTAKARSEDDWSAYADESWRGRAPGTAPLQPRVLHLLKRVGHDARSVPASNVVFVRSSRESDLARDKSAWLRACWPVHDRVIRALGVAVVACMGGTAGAWAREMLSAHEPVERWSEDNDRRWTSCTHQAPSGIQVVTLTHPSVAAWNSHGADPSALVVAALRRA